MNKSDYVLFYILIFKNYFQKMQQILSLLEVIEQKGERKSLQLRDWKGGEIMQASSFEKAIEAQFDCLVKKVITCEQKKYYRDIFNRKKREITFSDLPEKTLSKFSIMDDYSSNYTAFNVLGMEVQVLDEQLSKILKILPDKKRNIILLSYFMDMSDSEIGQLMNLVKSTIYRHRTSTLEGIRKMYEERCKDE